MAITTASDSIGLDYRINLAQLSATIEKAKAQVDGLNRSLAAMSKKSSATIAAFNAKMMSSKEKFTAKSNTKMLAAHNKNIAAQGKASRAANKQFEKDYNARVKAQKVRTKEMLADQKKITAANAKTSAFNKKVAEDKIKVGTAANSRLVSDQKKSASEQQKIAKAGNEQFNKGYASRVKSSKQATTKMLADSKKATASRAKAMTDFKETYTKAMYPSKELKKMGVTAGTTTAQFHKMNLKVADHAKIAKLTRQQVKELSTSMASSGKATEKQAHQFNRLSKRLEHSEYQVRKQTSAMGDARRAQERWGAGFKYMMLSQAAWIASGAIIFGTIQGLAQGLRDFLSFNQGLVDAAAITQATASGYERLEKAAMSAFKSSTMGAKEATDALQILGQAGMDAADAAIALETVYKVTTATGGSTTEVVKFLTTAINVWKLSAEDAAKVGNILGAALNYSKLEVDDLGTTFNYVASIAHKVSMSIEELAATMAVMANAGIRASTIGTGLRGVISKLIEPTPKLRKELKAVEIKFEDVSLASHTLFESLETLAKGGFDLQNIFAGLRRREAAALVVMLDQGVDAFNMMAEALKDTTAIEVMFERSMMGMQNQLILTGHQIQAVLIDSLKASKPIIIGVAKAIQALVAALRDLSPLLIGISITLAIVKVRMMLTAAAAVKAAAAAAKVAVGFTAAQVAATNATVATGAFNTALMFLKSHWIITGITLLIGGYMAIKAATDAATDSIEELVSKSNQRVDDIRKLQVLMLDSNRTDAEKVLILADYAKKEKALIPLLDDKNISLKKTLKITKAIIKEEKDAIETAQRQQLEQLKLRLEIQKTEQAAFEAREKTFAGKLGKFLGVKRIIDPKLLEDIKLLEAVLNPESYKVTGEILPYKMSSDATEELEKLRYDQASAAEQARKDFIKNLSVFKLTETNKTKVLEKALKDRDATEKKYKTAKGILKGIEDKKGIGSEEYGKQETITNGLKIIWDRRKRNYSDLAEGITRITKKYTDEVLKIEKDAAEKIEDIKTKAFKKLQDSVDEREKLEADVKKNANKVKDELSKVKDDYEKTLLDSEEDSYEKRIKIWEKENTDRREKYAKLLKFAKDYYDAREYLAKTSPFFKAELEGFAASIIAIQAAITNLGIVEAATKPKPDEADSPKGMADGIAEGLKEASEEFKDEFTTWKDLTKETANAMKDTMSDVFFDSMMGELKTAGDYWRAFTTSVKRMIADMAAKWVMFQAFKGAAKSVDWLGTVLSVGAAGAGGAGGGTSGIEGVGDFPTGGGVAMAHSGGLIKKMHDGGLASDETMRVLKNDEYVIKDSSTRSIGVAALNYANSTGRLPQAQPQQIIHKTYNYVYAIDSESMDLALRKRGAGAISDISLNANAYGRARRDPRAGR